MKFKRVEIQAFKSYLNKQDGTFDFTLYDGKAADMVSIYAPNGFGKTSFYDAIDFCMTNNITRFVRYKSLANGNNADAKSLNQSGQKQHILRAKNAPETLESLIEISTDIGDFKSEKIVARSGSKDYTFDDSKTEPGRRYFRSVMLSQEAIDGFLRESKPEVRYERFMDEQLAGDDTLERNRQCIQSMLGELSTKLDKLNNEVMVINDKNMLIDLGGASALDSSSLILINELVSSLNEMGCKFPLVDSQFDVKAKERLFLQIAQLEEITNKEINRRQEEKNQRELLLKNLPKYEKNHNDVVTLKNKIVMFNKQKSDFEKFKELNDKNSVLTEQHAKLHTELELLRTQESQLPYFIESMKAKSEHSKKLKRVRDDLTKNDEASQNSKVVVDELKKQKLKLVEDKDKFEKLGKNAADSYSKIAELEKRIKQHNSIDMAAEIDELNKRIANEENNARLLKRIQIEGHDFIVSNKLSNEIFANLAKDYASILANMKTHQSQHEDIQGLIDSTKQQEGSISALIELGSKLINTSHDQHCPLCQHKHDSFSALANAINSNSSLSTTQQRLLKELEECQSLLKQQNDKLKELNNSFSAAQTKYIAASVEVLQRLFQEKKSKSEQLKEIEKDTIEVSRVKTLTAHKSPENFKLYVDNELSKILKEIALRENKIDETDGEYKSLEAKKLQLQIELASTSGQSSNKEFITDYSIFLRGKGISSEILAPKLDEQALTDFISSQLQEAISLFEKKQQEIRSNSLDLKTLYTPYSTNHFDGFSESKERIINKIDDVSEQLTQSYELVSEFYTRVKLSKQVDLLENANWKGLKQFFEQDVADFHHLLEQERAKTSGLSSLIVLAEKVFAYTEYVKSTTERQKLELEIAKCGIVKKQLMEDLKSINTSLKTKIDQYFHVDLINTIYRKIDPHPDFKR
ncbi:MAG: exonuclease SbcC, partial [Flavobacteriaceae bacterium]